MLNLQDFKNKLQMSGAVTWKEKYSLESFWCFEMKSGAEEIWTYLSDTSRFNREMGFSPREETEVNGKALVKTSMAGFEQIWIELPWSWVAPETINFERIYQKGMASNVQSVFHIERHDAGCRVYIYFGWQLPHFYWKLFLKVTEPVVKGKFGKNFAKIDSYLQTHKRDFSGRALKLAAKPLPPQQEARLNDIHVKLRKKGLDLKILDSLMNLIRTGDDMDVETLRILKLSDEWGFDHREVLATALHATRAGLLDISWNVICPHCRASRFSAGSLGEIPTVSDCGPCDVDFSTSDADVIEIVFKINKSVRDVKEVLYCAAEPAKKSHIKVQREVAPGHTVYFKVTGADRFCRARIQGKEIPEIIQVDKKSALKNFVLFSGAVLPEAPRVAPGADLQFTNTSQEPVWFSFEDLQWSTTALKPSQVLAFPEFRDLFAEEHLDASVKLSLGQQTLMFTDMVGSTKFYRKVGDAKAFAEVNAHFQEIFQEVKKHNGLVVKTIGDAVMAAFPTLEDGYAAAREIQKKFHQNRADLSVRLRISLHAGNVIAVQLHSGVDYFGTTVNLGAKIQSCAGAGEIALTQKDFEALQQVMEPSLYAAAADKIYSSDAELTLPVRVVKIELS